ncbi:RDD family protein [Guptibacillus hwajinpoensis]|uniref:RDD family protein n=1 Tax=Guptibacillus hwajinpoensis TaxID=208199 RepID=UPI00069E887D|nr:RDD family protein [Alkalihalobacillus macyae]
MEKEIVIDRPAGAIRRGFGNVLDGILLVIVSVIFDSIVNGEQLLIFDFIEISYYILLPVIWVGYTVGKKLVGVQINRINGKRVNLWTMIRRHLLAGIVLASPFIIAALLMVIMVDDIPYTSLIGSNALSESEIELLDSKAPELISYVVVGGIATLILNLVNVFMVGLRKDHRGIHDFIAGTYVKLTKS